MDELDAVKPKQEGIVGAILAGVAAVHSTPIDTELNKLRQYVIIAD
jgi:hypothetical protein